jgi:hypothetical protein
VQLHSAHPTPSRKDEKPELSLIVSQIGGSNKHAKYSGFYMRKKSHRFKVIFESLSILYHSMDQSNYDIFGSCQVGDPHGWIGMSSTVLAEARDGR